VAGDLFESAEVVAGYATDRPAVHPQVVDLVRARIGLTGPVGRAVDIGCGAGASTAAVRPVADWCLGVDPSPAMVHRAVVAVAGASFAVAAAEALPVVAGSVDLVSAAGSLDFADQAAARAEVVRVLRDGGKALVYDFGTGVRLAGGRTLAGWLDGLRARWPKPPRSLPAFSPEAFEGPDLRAIDDVLFEVPVPLGRERYLDYLMTESNVTHAVALGADRAEVRAWCSSTLPWEPGATETVVFEGRATTYRRTHRDAPG
jgi:SAM-dependent methyltransferase